MDKLKRYQWFGYDQYYPAGGSCDIMGEGETLDELREAIRLHNGVPGYNQVMDLQERRWFSEAEAGLLGIEPRKYQEA